MVAVLSCSLSLIFAFFNVLAAS